MKIFQYIGLSDMENKIICGFTLQLVFIIIYKKLIQRTESSIMLRKIYGMMTGIIFMIYFYKTKYIFTLSGIFIGSYYLSFQCKTKKKLLYINLLQFVVLFLAHLKRIVYEYEDPNGYGFAVLLMLQVQKINYFNVYINQMIESKDESKSQEITLLDYFCYQFNVAGIQFGPVMNYEEFLQFIHQSNKKKMKNQLVFDICTFLFCLAFTAASPLFWDSELINSSRFGQLPFYYKIVVIILQSLFYRIYYYIGFQFATFSTGILEIKQKDSDLQLRTMNIIEIETNCSPRHRIANWNVHTSNWLRIIFYDGFQNLKLKRNQSFLITFLISSFWHGLYPSYYLGFFIIQIISRVEKGVFKKGFKYFPPFIYYFYFDLGCVTFKSLLFSQIKQILNDTKEFWFFLLFCYVFSKLLPGQKKKVNQLKFILNGLSCKEIGSDG